MEKISRKEFLKRLTISSAITSAALVGCTKIDKEKIPTDKMEYRTNPKTKEKVSLLGYGCMRWPTIENENENESNIDQKMVNRLVDYAIEHGVNYFDTAPVYCQGQSETATGIALSRHPRSKFFVATKLSNFAPSTWSREESMKMYNDSFKNLQVDYIDYYLLHSIGGGGEQSMETFESRYIKNGMLDFLLEERAKGKIRNLGFSYHGDIKIFDYLLSQHDKYKWDFVQIQMNYLDWHHAKQINERNTNAEYLYNELSSRNIPVVIMEPLLGGRLSKVADSVATHLKEREPEKSVASWAFRFVGSYSGVLTVLSGMTYMEHLQDNLKTYCPFETLTQEELQYLFQTADLMMKFKTIPCNDCKYCMPCPYGLDIPAILLYYNKHINEQTIPDDHCSANYRSLRRKFLIGYDRAVESLRNADHCVGCRKCVEHCPQSIDIPHQIHMIGNLIEKLKRDEI